MIVGSNESEEFGAALEIETIGIGEKVYLRSNTNVTARKQLGLYANLRP